MKPFLTNFGKNIFGETQKSSTAILSIKFCLWVPETKYCYNFWSIRIKNYGIYNKNVDLFMVDVQTMKHW